MKKRKTLLLAVLLSIVASVAVSSCSPYWYDDYYYDDYYYSKKGMFDADATRAAAKAGEKKIVRTAAVKQ